MEEPVLVWKSLLSAWTKGGKRKYYQQISITEERDLPKSGDLPKT